MSSSQKQPVGRRHTEFGDYHCPNVLFATALYNCENLILIYSIMGMFYLLESGLDFGNSQKSLRAHCGEHGMNKADCMNFSSHSDVTRT